MGRLLRQKTDTNLITFHCVAALFIKHHSWRLQRQHILTQFPRVSKYVLRTWNPNSAKPGFQETGYRREFYNFLKFCTLFIINNLFLIWAHWVQKHCEHSPVQGPHRLQQGIFRGSNQNKSSPFGRKTFASPKKTKKKKWLIDCAELHPKLISKLDWLTVGYAPHG